jgi:hypothetical protein
MKIVITSEGTSLESSVDPRFGRAKHFLLMDTDTGEFSAHDNAQNLNATQGAGTHPPSANQTVGHNCFWFGDKSPRIRTTDLNGVVSVCGVEGQ